MPSRDHGHQSVWNFADASRDVFLCDSAEDLPQIDSEAFDMVGRDLYNQTMFKEDVVHKSPLVDNKVVLVAGP